MVFRQLWVHLMMQGKDDSDETVPNPLQPLAGRRGQECNFSDSTISMSFGQRFETGLTRHYGL
jgi:hypothetical protein